MLYSVNFNKNTTFNNFDVDEEKKELITENLKKLKNIQSLTFEQLTNRMKEKEVVKVVSCYYGVNQLNDFLGNLTGRNRSTDVILCATGVSKENWGVQVNALLDDEMGVRLGQRQNVYLYTKFTLLHSKIYFSKSTRYSSAYGATCLLGSANLSQNAFECNEEVLADIHDDDTKNAVENYIDFILNDKDNLIDIRALQNQKRREGKDFKLDLTSYGLRQETTSVLDYLLSGYLAFKCSRNFSLGFSNDDWRREINNTTENSEYIKNQKTLDMAAVLNVRGLDEFDNDFEEENNSRSTSQKKYRISIRANSIETCFGYWIPQKAIAKINSSIKNPQKEDDYKNIKGAIEGAIENDQKKLTDDVHKRLMKAFDDVGLAESRRGYFECKIVDHLQKQLGYYEKNRSLYLSGCYFITPMPNFFEDPTTKLEFIESFWEDVKFRRESNRIAKEIYDLFKGTDDEMMDLSNELNKV